MNSQGRVFVYPFSIKSLISFLLLLSIVMGVSCCFADKTVTDLGGTEVFLPDSIERIATIEPVGYQFLIIIDEEDKLTGACTGWANRTLLKKINPVFSKLPWPGDPNSVNLEELLKENPDLVISKVGYDESTQSMRDIGLDVVEIYPENPEELLKSVSLLGEALDKEDKANEYISYFEKTLNQIREKTEKIPENDKKKIYLMGSSPLDTAGSDYYQHYMVTAAGGINVAGYLTGGWNSISLEEVYSWDPDVIIMMPYTSANPEEIAQDPAWQKVDAVKNNQIYRLPEYIMAYDMPGPESILGIMWMATILYPDNVQYDLNEEFKDFYSTFYGLDLTNADIKQIITDQSKMQNFFEEIPGLGEKIN
ncbi:hypothetical protein DLD82_00395 [Methanospirillum stamsii]|uniref:Fe/B12 periplasmic-binding domain-containing protein n=2 Tax=Methanospirillum stamsii TaxID=1277351 RepID=A0A2V2N8R3_9EURY|nr:hypothetical protein DLD82_00395 [Methanospirillum stamsii]